MGTTAPRWKTSPSRAGVSKQTVYKHFTDKQNLFADIVLSTTDDMDALVGLIADRLSDTTDPAKDLEHLAETFLDALMQPRVLRLRRLVISSADRFPEIATAWYEKGFERALGSTLQELPNPRGATAPRRRRPGNGSRALRRDVVLDPGQQGHVHR